MSFGKLGHHANLAQFSFLRINDSLVDLSSTSSRWQLKQHEQRYGRPQDDPQGKRHTPTAL